MLAVTLKGLRAHKARLALTMVSIVLGVGFVAGTFIYTDTINAGFESLFTDAFAGLDVTVRATPDPDLGLVATGRMPESVLEDVAGVEGVDEAWGNVIGYAQFVRSDPETGALEPISAGGPSFGFSWPETDLELGPRIVEGRPPQAGGEATMDVTTAERHSFQIGDQVRILFSSSSEVFTLVGFTGLGEGGQPGGFTSATFDLSTAQRVLDAEGQLDTIDVVAVPETDIDELVSRINAVLPAGFEAITAQTAAEEQATSIRQALGFFNTFLLVFAGVAVFVGAFIIQNTFRIIVAHRTRELALLRAIGASVSQITTMVLVEAAVVGAAASLLGLVVGVGLASLLESALGGLGIIFPEGNTQLQARTVVVALLVGILVTLVSAVIPARQAARVPPLAALHTTDVAPPRRSLRKRVLAGLTITGLGALALFVGLFAPVAGTGVPGIAVVGAGVAVFFIGIAVLSPAFARPVVGVIAAPFRALGAVSGRLAAENSMRSPRRTSATASALMIGLALVALVAILGDSAKATVEDVFADILRADLYVQPANQFGPNAGFPSSLADELELLPEVALISRVRTSQAKVEGEVTFIGAAEPNIEEAVDLGLIAGSLDRFAGNSAAVSASFAESRALEVGSEISIAFAASGEQAFEVVAIYESETAGPVLIPLSTFEQNYVEQLDAFIYIKLGQSVGPDEGRKLIESVAQAYPTAVVLDAAEFQRQAQDQVDQLLNVLVGLLSLAIIISVLGITNTLSLSVIERTREIGLLRAVGMSRFQVRRMVRLEAVVTSIFGALLGVGIGIFFAWALVEALRDQGIRFSIPFLQLVLLVGLAALAGVLAAIPPARRAAGLDILRAIAYE